YDKFEHTAAVSGKAGNIKGQIQAGGNPFESPRARDYPLPPLTPILASQMFGEAAKGAGYHPFPTPSANASRAYTNPDGAKFGACQYCGFCQRFGCEANAKGSPHLTVIPIAMRNPNFELRAHSWVTKVLKDSDGKRVTGSSAAPGCAPASTPRCRSATARCRAARRPGARRGRRRPRNGTRPP